MATGHHMCGEPRALDSCGECGRRGEHLHAEGGGEPRALVTLDRGIACVSGDLRDATLAWSMGGFRHASVGMRGFRHASVGMRGVRGSGLRAQVQRRPRVERMPLLGLRRGRGE